MSHLITECPIGFRKIDNKYAADGHTYLHGEIGIAIRTNGDGSNPTLFRVRMLDDDGVPYNYEFIGQIWH